MNKLQSLLLGIRLAGLPNSFKALKYTGLRDRLDARFAAPKAPSEPQLIGRLIKASTIPSGAKFEFEFCVLAANFLTPDLIFLAWDGAQKAPSYAVEKTDWDPVTTTLDRSEEGWKLESDSLKLVVSDDGYLLFLDSQGKLLRREDPPLKYGGAWLHQADLPAEACIYGMGERAARLNLRPGSYRCWNKDAGGGYSTGADPTYISMPLYLCLQDGAACLAFYDNSFDATFIFDDSASARFEGGPLRYYLAFGTPSGALELFTELTGRAPLPPRWALGYQHSRWGFNSEAEMRRVFNGFRRHDLPLSVLYMDIDFMHGYRVFTPDTGRYPALADFAAEMEKADAHLVAMTDPGVKLDPDWDIYTEGLAQDAYCKDPEGNVINGVVWPGWVVYPDFTSPRVRQWWGTLYTRLFKNGIAGLWQDMNEPVSYTASGEMTLPLCTRHNLEGAGGDHRQAHNVYGMLMNQAGYEAFRKLKPDERPFILSRSGWAGMQRYSWCWTGDIETSWQAMRQTIATVLGLGLSGQPYSGPDTGGFTKHPSAEHYVRWFQLSSFLPVFRTHCAFYLPRREPWEFGPKALEILRSFLELRYKLMPYWYTLAWQASQHGQPIVRPLFWNDPGSRDLWHVDDQFLVGDDLLVAPVLNNGERKRQVLLPGGRWYNFWSDEMMEGGREAVLEAPLEQVPLLVRAGSIVPMAENGNLTLHIYHPVKGGQCSSTLYSDQGDGYGPGRVDRFRLEEAGLRGYDLSWASEGDFDWPYKSTELKLHGFGQLEVKLKKVV